MSSDSTPKRFLPKGHVWNFLDYRRATRNPFHVTALPQIYAHTRSFLRRRHGGRKSGRWKDGQRAARKRGIQPVLHRQRFTVLVVRTWGCSMPSPESPVLFPLVLE